MLAFCVEEKWRKLRNGFSILSGWYHASHLRYIKCGRRVKAPGLAPVSRPQKEEKKKKVLLNSNKI